MKRELGCENANIKVIRNGIKINNFQRDLKKRDEFRKKFGLDSDLTILSVGMPIRRKGIQTFINISSKLKKEKFVWVGKISLPILQKELGQSTNNLIKTGRVDSIVSAYSGADIFCFPSLYEGQGLVILEAAANGLPLIVRDIPTYNEWLFDGKNCLKARNDKEFLEKIEFLKDNPKEMKKLSNASLKLARENDIDQMAKKLIKAFREVI